MPTGENVGESVGENIGESGLTAATEAPTFGTPEASFTEDLNEMGARRSRQSLATWGANYLEDASNNYIWQPESLAYNDTTYGYEVMIVVRGRDLREFWSAEFGTNAWNYNGSAIGIWDMGGNRPSNDPSFINASRQRWVVKSNGSGLHSINAVGNTVWPDDDLFGWARQENAYFGWGDGNGYSAGVLYKVNFDADMFVTTVTEIANTGYSADRITIKNGVSTMDTHVIAYYGVANTWSDPCVANSSGYFHKVNIDAGTAITWGIDRGVTGFTTPGADGTNQLTWHDAFGIGPDCSYVIVNPGSTKIWLSFKTEGSCADNGPEYEAWDGDSFGINEEIRYISGLENSPENPYNITYFGHPSADVWGKYMLVGTTSDDPSPGTRIYDIENNSLLPNYPLRNTYDGTHHSWSGWTDKVVGMEVGGTTMIMNDYTGGQGSKVSLVSLYYPDPPPGGQDDIYPRPSQSPDGTKIAISNVWLNSAEVYPYIAYVVAVYPYPATNLGATWSGGITLTWLPPTYTTRGWPTDTDPAPYAREIKQYRVWRSTTSTGPWTSIGVVSQSYTNHATYGHTPTIADCTYTDNPGAGTWYYAITCEEHSGLASDELSEILQVISPGNSVSSTTIVVSQGQTGFWTTNPSNASTFTVVDQATTGHVQLDWIEPSDANDLIRHYNIYYCDNGIPEPIQQFKIASLPKGTASWLDWNADRSTSTHYYAITTVDKYGNESSAVNGNS